MEIKVLITDQERTFAEAFAARLDDEEDIEVAKQRSRPERRVRG